MASAKPASNRIASLDQFRGYTVAGMFLVNFLGGFVAAPMLCKHHNTFFSYADTIMPQFFFAVGFAFRLTFGRRAKSDGLVAAYGHIVRRLLGLILISIILDRIGQRAPNWATLVANGPWQALRDPLVSGWWGPLTHIALTSLWILPVIRAGAAVRIAFATASALLHMALTHWFYFDFGPSAGADGGPIGFLAWTLPTIVGTLACDAITAADGRPRLGKMIAGAAGLMTLGYVLSCGTTLYNVSEEELAARRETKPGQKEKMSDPVIPSAERLRTHSLTWAEPPFARAPDGDHRERNYWMMSQRVATISYHTFGAGFSLAVYVLFYFACDLRGWQLGLFRTFGSNALIAFILHELVSSAIKPFVPGDSPWWYCMAAFALYFGVTYMMVRSLEKQKIYLKL
jgi:predicted acyltransferase